MQEGARHVDDVSWMMVAGCLSMRSFQVTMDTCKWMYAMWIMWDHGLTRAEGVSHSGSGQDGPHVRNSDIAEDLGVVDVLLTDKTGTLTENVMVLKVVSVGGAMYGLDHLSEHAGAGAGCVTVATDASLLAAVRGRRVDVLQAMRVLALCNSVAVVPSGDASGGLHYEACSPDEEALVASAAGVGVVLEERSISNVSLRLLGELERYAVLKELEFTSDRKRMSVVLQEEVGGRVVVLTKGADESVMPLLARGQEETVRQTHSQIEDMARQGLRTLILAWREVPRKEYEAWERDVWRPANLSVEARGTRMAQAYDRIERDFVLLGGTGIEDKLQDGVPEAVTSLRGAGVRVWMATGDKLSTARQVATSCGLLASYGCQSSNVVTISVIGQMEVSMSQLEEAGAQRRSGYESRHPSRAR